MLINNYKNLIKLLLVLVLAFLVSSFVVKNVFLADTPKIRPNLGGYLMAKINSVKENMLAKLNFNFVPSSQPQVPVNEPPANTVAENQTNQTSQTDNGIVNVLKESLKPVTQGVSAAEKDGYSYTEFKLDEIEWVQITYTLNNGKQITIQYPKGTEPPPKEIYEGRE
jgi:hypothetical protein